MNFYLFFEMLQYKDSAYFFKVELLLTSACKEIKPLFGLFKKIINFFCLFNSEINFFLFFLYILPNVIHKISKHIEIRSTI